MRLFRLIVGLSFPLLVQAQSYITPVADKSQYAFALFECNPGSPFLSRHPVSGGKSIGLMATVYGENNLIPGGNKYFSLLSAFPVSPGNINFLLDYAGAGDYHEMQTGIGYSRNLGELLQIGVRFNYYRLRIVGYGAGSAFPVEAGAVFQLFPKLRTSLYVYNLMSAGPKGEWLSKIPTIVRFGIGYAASESVGLSIEIIKESGKSVSFQPIIFYQAAGKLFFRAGFATNTGLVFISGGYVLGKLRLDLSTSYMGTLGWTTGLGLQFTVVQKKQP
ncbi:MAG: hypothetical protein ACRC2O_02345 [Chitinophagaceae bacterium]